MSGPDVHSVIDADSGPRLSGRKPALLVIDPQVEAVLAEGALTTDGGSAALANITRLLEAARSAPIPVIFTQELHRRELVDFGRELDGAEPIHCLEGTAGAALLPETQPRAGEWLIQKRRYSAFFATDLELLLRGLRVDTLVVCGFLTDVCVHYTCVDAHQRDYHLILASDATAGSSAEASQAALRAVAYLQSGSVTDAARISTALRSLTGTAPRSPAGSAASAA